MGGSEKNPVQDTFLLDFLRFRTRLMRAVGRIAQVHDVEDIVQETFLRCYDASSKTTIRHPRSFMLATAKNIALNHVTRAGERLTDKVDSFDDTAVPIYGARTEDTAEVEEQFLFFCRAVRHLPVQCRRAFLLRKVYGLSRREIAIYMGITESTVHKHIVMCAEFMQENGFSEGSKARDTAPRKKRSG